MTKLQDNRLTKKTNKKLFYSTAIVLTSFFIVHLCGNTSAQAKPISRQAFAGGLASGCAENRSEEICFCYAKAVISRYNTLQADAMYRLMKLKPESRTMFFLVHAPEMNACIKSEKK